MYHLGLVPRVVLGLALAINLLIVLVFKLLVLKWSMRMATSVRVLILVDELERLVAAALFTMLFMYDIVEGKSMIDEMGWSECTVYLVGTACFYSIFYGGLAISTMRIIYIKGSFFISFPLESICKIYRHWQVKWIFLHVKWISQFLCFPPS